MATLRDTMSAHLAGWQGDLDPAWRTFFAGVEPRLGAIPETLDHDPALPVIPGRRGRPPAGAPADSHMLRAFDRIAPADVRVVIIGQDPYPRVDRATGRAFEDGALKAWSGVVAVSLQRLMQSALALRLGRNDADRGPGDWFRLREEVRAGALELEPPETWFDRLQREHGVLWVNAGWTLTRYVQGGGPEQKAHIAMWRPVMNHLLTGLASRPDTPLVALLLGGFARKLFEASGARSAAEANGSWGRLVTTVEHPHPSAIGATGYLAAGNPLAAVNAALARAGASPVSW